MTRCREFYLKWKNEHNFCESPYTCGIDAHIRYMDSFFEEWLESASNYERYAMSEKAVRYLIPVQYEPFHDKILADIRLIQNSTLGKIVSKTSEEYFTNNIIKDLIKKHRVPELPELKTKAVLIHGDFRDHLPESIDLLITDPPYMTDIDDINGFVREWIPLVLDRLSDAGQAYIFTGAYWDELRVYINELDKYKRFMKQVLVWEYTNTLGPSPKEQYKQNWQAIFYLRGPQAPPIDSEILIDTTTVQNVAMPKNKHHTWEKPIDLAIRLIRHSSKEDSFVFDPFAGTGTFLLAASQLGRVSVGTEIDAKMIKIAEQRGCTLAD